MHLQSHSDPSVISLQLLCVCVPRTPDGWHHQWSCFSGANLLFLLSLLVFEFFNLDKDEDDFDWARVCEEDAAGQLLLFLEELVASGQSSI